MAPSYAGGVGVYDATIPPLAAGASAVASAAASAAAGAAGLIGRAFVWLFVEPAVLCSAWAVGSLAGLGAAVALALFLRAHWEAASEMLSSVRCGRLLGMPRTREVFIHALPTKV